MFPLSVSFYLIIYLNLDEYRSYFYLMQTDSIQSVIKEVLIRITCIWSYDIYKYKYFIKNSLSCIALNFKTCSSRCTKEMQPILAPIYGNIFIISFKRCTRFVYTVVLLVQSVPFQGVYCVQWTFRALVSSQKYLHALSCCMCHQVLGHPLCNMRNKFQYWTVLT